MRKFLQSGLSLNNTTHTNKYQPTLHVCTSLMTNGILLITGFVNKDVIIPQIQIFGIYASTGKNEKSKLIKDLCSGCYQFAPLQSITNKNGQIIHLWSSQDALVLKLLTLHLTNVLPVSDLCTHIKSHGGLKAIINQVHEQYAEYKYVIRTDVKAYYAVPRQPE